VFCLKGIPYNYILVNTIIIVSRKIETERLCIIPTMECVEVELNSYRKRYDEFSAFRYNRFIPIEMLTGTSNSVPT
jgi:hypothetical protein